VKKDELALLTNSNVK